MDANTKYCLDANSLITSWHTTYPQNIFPNLWMYLAERKEIFIIIKPVFEEIEPYSGNDKKMLSQDEIQKKYPVRLWLVENEFEYMDISQKDEELALRLEKKYQTMENTKGANKKDIRELFS